MTPPWKSFGDGSFWAEAFAIRGSVTLQVVREVLLFTLWAALVFAADRLTPSHINMGIEVTPYEVAGAALGLLLVLRTNAGYDRWWEGRKLWGGIVNQSRTLAITALAHGPDDPDWRRRLLGWTAAFPHACRRSLRGERNLPELVPLVGDEGASQVAGARHMPTFVSARVAALLREAAEGGGLDRFAFLVAEEARNSLIDHVGGCERILKSPLPKPYAIDIRRFITLFLVTLPFGLLPRVGSLMPLAVFLVSYPILALDQIGAALQNPFSRRNLGHLPLDDICATIEGDLLALDADRPFRDGPAGVNLGQTAGNEPQVPWKVPRDEPRVDVEAHP